MFLFRIYGNRVSGYTYSKFEYGKKTVKNRNSKELRLFSPEGFPQGKVFDKKIDIFIIKVYNVYIIISNLKKKGGSMEKEFGLYTDEHFQNNIMPTDFVVRHKDSVVDPTGKDMTPNSEYAKKHGEGSFLVLGIKEDKGVKIAALMHEQGEEFSVPLWRLQRKR